MKKIIKLYRNSEKLFRIQTALPILMKLGSFDAFLLETKESVRKSIRSAPRTEILNVKVNDYLS